MSRRTGQRTISKLSATWAALEGLSGKDGAQRHHADSSAVTSLSLDALFPSHSHESFGPPCSPTFSSQLLPRQCSVLSAKSSASDSNKTGLILVDALTLSLIKGSTLDYATELIGSSFRLVDNPQATGKGCGCGVSWEMKI